MAYKYFHQETKEWPRQRGGVFQSARGDAEAAFDFLAAARCFLHFRHGRDDNTLDWQSQDEPLRYITQRYTKAIEDFVREDPAQYWWVHRRWKTRPKGEAAEAYD